MPVSKIVDRQEVLRWFKEGKTYDEMRTYYLEHYHIETGLSMWSNFRNREGLDKRINRNDENLMPWAVRPEHRWAYPAKMLRFEGRRRAGKPLRPKDEHELDNFIARRVEENTVVHYDPDFGFAYVPRQPGDGTLIHMPEHPKPRPTRE